MQPECEDYTFSQNQYEDYLTLNGIVNRTGVPKEDTYAFILKELIDNAVDGVEKSHNPIVEVNISRIDNLLCIVVRNLNESNMAVLKLRLEQRGLCVSSMKYKSRQGNYSSISDGIGFPFFVEVAVFHSDNIIDNLDYMNALNNAIMPGGWSYLYAADDDTFVWFTESDREKNNRTAADDLDVKSHKSRSIHEILAHYGYNYDDKKSRKKHSLIAINLVAPKIIVENYGKSDIVLEPFAGLISELVARACEGGGTQEDRPSRIECMRKVIKQRIAAVKADKTLRNTQRWTRSTGFYTCRRLLKHYGYADEEIKRKCNGVY
jgi:hypothetical protein